ncbi:MAG: hypothetical protein ACSLEL_01410 [Candidatus Malihini olakiniferum]
MAQTTLAHAGADPDCRDTIDDRVARDSIPGQMTSGKLCTD